MGEHRRRRSQPIWGIRDGFMEKVTADLSLKGWGKYYQAEMGWSFQTEGAVSGKEWAAF